MAQAANTNESRMPERPHNAGRFDRARETPSVESDDDATAVLAAEHLLERALPHDGFYGLPPSGVTVWSDDRCATFGRRMLDHLMRLDRTAKRGDGEARRLVTTTDLPLKAVAPRTGPSSGACMTTLFRRHFGMTPAPMWAASRGRASSAPSR